MPYHLLWWHLPNWASKAKRIKGVINTNVYTHLKNFYRKIDFASSINYNGVPNSSNTSILLALNFALMLPSSLN
jgi:hypothetical protein